MESTRKTDSLREIEVGKFLDKYVYTNNVFTEVNRITDKSQQLSGIDVMLTSPEYHLEDALVDEKAGITRWDKDLHTFILELSFINKFGKITDGWFVDENKLTQYFGFVWLRATKKDFMMEDITKVEYALVEKKTILKYLRYYGFDIPMLKNCSDAIRERGYVKMNKDYPFHLSYTPTLAEKPINLVVPKKDYFKMATWTKIVNFENNN